MSYYIAITEEVKKFLSTLDKKSKSICKKNLEKLSSETVAGFDKGERAYLVERARVGTQVKENLELGIAADFAEGAKPSFGFSMTLYR